MNRTQLYERQRLIALAKLNRFSDLMLEKKQDEEEEERNNVDCERRE